MKTAFLRQALDLHVHTAPDGAPRILTDLELAREAMEAGMAGFVSKCHQGDTSARAAVATEALQLLYPGTGFQVLGGVVLNHGAGGLNPSAVYASGKMGGRLVWFPTVDAENDALYKKAHAGEKGLGGSNEQPLRKPKIRILDDQGNLVPEVKEVLAQIRDFDMVLATGHISPRESLALVREAAEQGIRKILVNHVSLPITRADLDLQKAYAACGAMVEHCYYTPMAGLCPWEEIVRSIQCLGADHVILSTDLGQPGKASPVKGLAAFAERLFSLGVGKKDLHQMMVENPRRMMEMQSLR